MKLKSDIKVGLFVLMGIVLAGLVVFLIGEERRFFDRAVEYQAKFDDVAGLKRGAPVELGGVRIGQVLSVGYEGNDARVLVRFSIVKTEAQRIRTDSVAKIVPKGMLGDRMVAITRGEGESLPPGKTIPTEEPEDLMGAINAAAGSAKKAIGNIDKVAENLSDENLHKDIRESAHSINVLLKMVTEGDGYPTRLLTDKNEADRITNVIKNLDTTTQELALAVREVRYTAARVRKGPGFAHDLIYGSGPSKEIAQVGFAAEQMGLTLQEIREGDGFAHDILFGGNGDTKDAMSNITQITADVRDIVRGVKEGKGTIGALLVDPSIYEDLKRVLGNVERNSVLRALVRYGIKKDKKKRKPKVTGGK